MDTATYWESRAVKFGHVSSGLPAVCSYGMPNLYNRAIHACQRRALAPWINNSSNLDVLDVGCGVGRWSLDLAGMGNRVLGIDISPRMIEIAKARSKEHATECEFLVGDVASLELSREFDLILTVTVLQHIMDDVALKSAVERLARHLRDDGTLVLLEVAPTTVTDRCNSTTFRARSQSHYETLLRDAGCELVDVHGVDIAPLRSHLLPAMKLMPKGLARGIAAASTFLTFPFDLALSRRLPDRCWHKVLVARRQ